MIEVFVDGEQTTHLAVKNERDGTFRSLCGAKTTDEEVKKKEASEVKVKCKDCSEQLKLWREVHE